MKYKGEPKKCTVTMGGVIIGFCNPIIIKPKTRLDWDVYYLARGTRCNN